MITLANILSITWHCYFIMIAWKYLQINCTHKVQQNVNYLFIKNLFNFWNMNVCNKKSTITHLSAWSLCTFHLVTLPVPCSCLTRHLANCDNCNFTSTYLQQFFAQSNQSLITCHCLCHCTFCRLKGHGRCGDTGEWRSYLDPPAVSQLPITAS